MKNLFKKNAIETRDVQGKKKFEISAKEALNISRKRYTSLPNETIFEKIAKRAEQGLRDAYFEGAYVTGEQLTRLKELGYKVDISTYDGYLPYFKVSW